MNESVKLDKNTMQKDTIQRNDNAYDDIPYTSFPYKQSSIEHLATMGKIFGMNPPKFETARVLELGSAEGGNIIPYAEKYPNGKFIGIDLSETQIASGKKHIKSLKLNNIELRHMSITDIDKKFGEFDYIICHGVLSWVPDFVADKIFEISNQNLSKNGIAYISYNTLPGWNMIRTIRDMMLYHVEDIAESKNKITQARAMLNFVKESSKDKKTPHSIMFSQEAELLANQSDHYLMHDHLEDNNKQYYFNDFMKKASKNNLQYLADSSLPSMYVGNMGQEIAQKLGEIKDIVRSEQYMDFINNRRFRSTLLCHSDIKLSRNLNNDHIRMFAMSFDIVPEKPLAEIDLESNESIKFFIDGDKDRFIESSSPEFKAILHTFHKNLGYPQAFDSVIKKANAMFKDDRKQKLEADLLQNGMNLVIKGLMSISTVEKTKKKSTTKPKISKLALYQAKDTQNLWVTTLNHSPLGINIFEKLCMGYMDGKNTKEQIIDNVVKKTMSKEININKENVVLEKEEDIRIEVTNHMNFLMEKLSKNSVMI